jgi:hypothetical protein
VYSIYSLDFGTINPILSLALYLYFMSISTHILVLLLLIFSPPFL